MHAKPTVAVVGHRRNRLSLQTCRDLIESFETAFQTLPDECTLLTGMADGSDLAACRAARSGWMIHGVLAQAPDKFSRYLGSASKADKNFFNSLLRQSRTITEVMPPPYPNYEAVAEAIVARADVIYAVWDGSFGGPGGTGDVVFRAGSIGTKVLLLDPSQMHSGWVSIQPVRVIKGRKI